MVVPPERVAAKFERIESAEKPPVLLQLAPQLLKMPLPMQRYDDPFLPFGKATIEATSDLLFGYVFDLASYLALGAAGAVALERTIAYAQAADDVLTVLHAPFASEAFSAAASDAAFNVDVATITEVVLRDAFVAVGVEVAIWHEETLEIGQGRTMRVLADNVLYAGRGDDFAQQVRAAVQAALP